MQNYQSYWIKRKFCQLHEKDGDKHDHQCHVLYFVFPQGSLGKGGSSESDHHHADLPVKIQ